MGGSEGVEMLHHRFAVTHDALCALLGRPDLWATAAGTAWRLRARGWWRRWPPLPVPDPRYRRFRAETMFGGDGSERLGRPELLEYLGWCREQHRGRWRSQRAGR
ncbi:MAG: hypothetical protein ACYC1D_18005 [Acidimicrobiales bacterium]